MSNHTEKFLTQWQMSEAKRSEAIMNSIQKREGTHFPLSNIIAWGCGCCIGPVIKRHDGPILSPQEADKILKARKVRRNKKWDQITLEDFRSQMAARFGKDFPRLWNEWARQNQ